eukprot:1180035-Prorocentrum_minimum.AAC.2
MYLGVPNEGSTSEVLNGHECSLSSNRLKKTERSVTIPKECHHSKGVWSNSQGPLRAKAAFRLARAFLILGEVALARSAVASSTSSASLGEQPFEDQLRCVRP